MKPLVIVGVLIAALGAFVLLRGLSYKTTDNVVKIGDLKVTAEEQHAVPAWAGAAAIAGGLVLVGAGMRTRRTT